MKQGGSNTLAFPAPEELTIEKFLEIYPNRKAKGEARKAWTQRLARHHNLPGTPAEYGSEITAALAWQIQEWASKEWYSPPLPASYLRGARWTDEPDPPKQLAPRHALPDNLQRKLKDRQQWLARRGHV